MHVRSLLLFTCLTTLSNCSLPKDNEPDPATDGGTRGAQGEQGANGASGADGQDGANGKNGADGAQGETGAMGATGARGERGPAGSDGATGPRGETGPIGPTGAQGPQGPVGPAGPAGTPGEAVATDGTRLKVIHITSADGLRSPLGGYWDAQLETTCSIARAGNRFRCLPLSGSLLFADAECTERVVAPYQYTTDEARYARLLEIIDGVYVYRNFELLSEISANAPVYVGSPASCTDYTSGLKNMLAAGSGLPRYIGNEVPDSQFAEVTYQHD